jgi:lipopolysaccharide biosynthesis glycosyltransferase
MIVFNLTKIRDEHIEQNFYDWTKANFETIKMGDQEIINEVLKGRIKIIEDDWNVQSSNFTNRSSYTHNPKVIHYVARKKPWHFISYSYHWKYYFKYLQLTPWKLQSKKEKFYWYYENYICSLVAYFLYRPLFLFRPRFYKAIFWTYISKK